jgi:protein TonB
MTSIKRLPAVGKAADWKAACAALFLFAASFTACAGTAAPVDAVAAPIGKNDVVTMPVLSLDKCRPVYPLESKKRWESGQVDFQVLIGADGMVKDLVIINSSGHLLLDKAVVDALARCKDKFTPGTINGKPANMWAKTSYVWQL